MGYIFQATALKITDEKTLVNYHKGGFLVYF